MTWKALYNLSQSNAIFIEGIPDVFMKSVYAAQLTLWGGCEILLDNLEAEKGEISNSKKNRKLIAAFAATYELFRQSTINKVIDDLLGYSNTVLHNNFNYYDSMLNYDQEFSEAENPNFDTFDSSGDPYKEKDFMQALSDATESINFRLGLTSAGVLITGGYLFNLYHDQTVNTYITQAVYKGMISGAALSDLKTTLKDDVIGETESLPDENTPKGEPESRKVQVTKNGLLGKVFSPVANDVFTQVDRTASTVIANATDLKYFIYGGTIVKNSRGFCIERCNKAYSTDDAKDWINASPGPIAVDPETYDPIVDMGGINCRHSPLFISSELYKVLVDKGSDLIPA
jgi:hypothetical protein